MAPYRLSNLLMPAVQHPSPHISGCSCSMRFWISSAVGKSHGLPAPVSFAPTVWPLELSEEYGHSIAVDPYEEEPLSRTGCGRPCQSLPLSERQAVLLYLEGTKPRRRAEREMLNIAMEKLREFYLALQDATEAMALLHTHQVFGGMISEP